MVHIFLLTVINYLNDYFVKFYLKLILGDIQDEKVVKKILDLIKDKPVASVLSDMAPNATGQKALDHDMIINLQLKAFNLAKICLKPNGTFLCKLWYGDGVEEFTKTLKNNFQTVKIVKPESSRNDSSECFILALKYKSQ